MYKRLDRGFSTLPSQMDSGGAVVGEGASLIFLVVSV